MRGLAVLYLFLAGCADIPERRAEAPAIVSLNPCSDAVLAEIAPENLLAVSHCSHDPAASSMPLDRAREFPATGGTVEEVLALGPDLVIADPFLPPATRHALERLGLRVETIGIASSVEDSIAQVRRLAALVEQPRAGDALAERIEAAWQESAWPGPKLNTLLWQEGGIVPGEQTLAAQMLAHTGFASHSAARGLGQGAYLPLEQVLSDPPDLVLAAGDERMMTHPVLRELGDIRYVTLSPNLLYCGGPSIVRALDRLAEIRGAP